MTSGKKRFLGVLLSCIIVSQPMILALASGIQPDDEVSGGTYNKSEIEAGKSDRQDKLNQVSREIEDLENVKNDLESNVAELDDRLNQVSKELESLSDDLTDMEKQIKNTKKLLKKARKEEESQYDSMKKRIRYMYESGNSSYIELLLSSENVTDLLNKADYISKISEYDRDMLAKFRETKDLIAEKEKELKQEYQEQEVLQAEVKQQEAQMQSVLSEKRTEIDKYDTMINENQELALAYAGEIEAQNIILAEIQAQEAMIADQQAAEQAAAAEAEEAVRRAEEAAAAAAEAAEEDQEQAQAEAAQRQAEAEQAQQAVTAPESSYSGGFVWPCPSSYTISSGFGYRESPTEGASSNHLGIDIAAPTGSAIVAAASGTVVIAQYSASAGNYVSISHGNGVYTIYMHASALYVSVGQQVGAGEAIAAVGSTGYSTGAHLHFAVTVNGAYVNPSNYL